MENGVGMEKGFFGQKEKNWRGCEGKETGEINIKEERDKDSEGDT